MQRTQPRPVPVLVLALGALLGAAPLLAQGAPASGAADRDDEGEVRYQKKTVIDLTNVVIEADIVRPSGCYLPARKRTKFRNLIEMRGSFRPELRHSVSGL